MLIDISQFTHTESARKVGRKTIEAANALESVINPVCSGEPVMAEVVDSVDWRAVRRLLSSAARECGSLCDHFEPNEPRWRARGVPARKRRKYPPGPNLPPRGLTCADL